MFIIKSSQRGAIWTKYYTMILQNQFCDEWMLYKNIQKSKLVLLHLEKNVENVYCDRIYRNIDFILLHHFAGRDNNWKVN